MDEAAIIGLLYKLIIVYFIVIFITNLFRKKKISDQVMYAAILVPFVLRLFSIK